MDKCIICGNKKQKEWSKAYSMWGQNQYSLISCTECEFISVSPMPSDKELADFYANYSELRGQLGAQKTNLRAQQYNVDRDFITNFFVEPGPIRMLDFGCFDGSFLNVFGERFIKHGVDLDQKAVNKARATRSFGNNINHGDITTMSYDNNYFDLITIRGVIEHLNNPDRVINKLYSILKPMGLLYICATPNVGSYSAQAFKNQWNQFAIPEHLLYFSDITLEKYLNKFGFRMLAKSFPYIETPYANLTTDMAEIKQTMSGKLRYTHVPFYNNMMNMVVFK